MIEPAFLGAVRRFVSQLNAIRSNPLAIQAITSGGIALVDPEAPKGNPLAVSVTILTGAPDGHVISSELAYSLLITSYQNGQGLREFFREDDDDPAPVSVVLVDHLTSEARRVLLQDLPLLSKWHENWSWIIATEDGELLGNCSELLLSYPTNLAEKVRAR